MRCPERIVVPFWLNVGCFELLGGWFELLVGRFELLGGWFEFLGLAVLGFDGFP